MVKKGILSLLLSLVCLIFFTQVQAGQDKVVQITAPEVKQMLSSSKVVLVNNLSSLEFELQHIPKSINIPIDKINDLSLLPSDHDIPIIFYCMASI